MPKHLLSSQGTAYVQSTLLGCAATGCKAPVMQSKIESQIRHAFMKMVSEKVHRSGDVWPAASPAITHCTQTSVVSLYQDGRKPVHLATEKEWNSHSGSRQQSKA